MIKALIRKNGAWSKSNIFKVCPHCGGLSIRGVCQKCAFTVVCCVCQKTRQPDGSFRAQGVNTGLRTSHTYCNPCKELLHGDVLQVAALIRGTTTAVLQGA